MLVIYLCFQTCFLIDHLSVIIIQSETSDILIQMSELFDVSSGDNKHSKILKTSKV